MVLVMKAEERRQLLQVLERLHKRIEKLEKSSSTSFPAYYTNRASAAQMEVRA